MRDPRDIARAYWGAERLAEIEALGLVVRHSIEIDLDSREAKCAYPEAERHFGDVLRLLDAWVIQGIGLVWPDAPDYAAKWDGSCQQCTALDAIHRHEHGVALCKCFYCLCEDDDLDEVAA